jgi:hypothetical protein
MVDALDVIVTGIFGSTRNPTSGVTSGRCYVGVTPTGKFDSNVPVSGIPFKEYGIPNASGLLSKLNTRFDDPTFYG